MMKQRPFVSNVVTKDEMIRKIERGYQSYILKIRWGTVLLLVGSRDVLEKIETIRWICRTLSRCSGMRQPDLNSWSYVKSITPKE